MNELIFGIDTSKYIAPVNWKLAKQQGVQYMFTRCTKGLIERDVTFEEHFKSARAAGVIPGSYHYLLANQDVNKQVDFWIDAMKRVGITDFRNVLLMVDCELGSGDIEHLNNFYEAFTRKVPNHQLVNYLPHWYWDEIGRGDTFAPIMNSHYVAGTGTIQELFAKVPGSWWFNYGNSGTHFLQFTDKAKVGGRSVDASIYRLPMDRLKKVSGAI